MALSKICPCQMCFYWFLATEALRRPWEREHPQTAAKAAKVIWWTVRLMLCEALPNNIRLNIIDPRRRPLSPLMGDTNCNEKWRSSGAPGDFPITSILNFGY